MARRTLLCLAILVALLLPALAAAAPPSGSLHLKGVDTSRRGTANGFAFTQTLYQGGKVVGTDSAVCRYRPRLGHLVCRVTVNLPSGKLFVRLPIFNDTDRGSFTVTRGTGRYEGRTGYGIYRSFPDHTKITTWLTS